MVNVDAYLEIYWNPGGQTNLEQFHSFILRLALSRNLVNEFFSSLNIII